MCRIFLKEFLKENRDRLRNIFELLPPFSGNCCTVTMTLTLPWPKWGC